MSESSARTIVLASPAKIGFAARVRVVDWPSVETLVVSALPPEFADGLGQHGVSVAYAT
jgi:DeoR/GlpR family transcriptional regulator of sugar metabolism